MSVELEEPRSLPPKLVDGSVTEVDHIELVRFPRPHRGTPRAHASPRPLRKEYC